MMAAALERWAAARAQGTIGQRIRAATTAAGMTQKKMASVLVIAQRALIGCERGAGEPLSGLVARTWESFANDTAWLRGGDGARARFTWRPAKGH